jgi:hypothetical protein
MNEVCEVVIRAITPQQRYLAKVAESFWRGNGLMRSYI